MSLDSYEDDDSGWDFGNGQRTVASGKTVFRFRVELPLYDDHFSFDEPRRTVSRLIEVPDDYTFWDLHVAIQSAMGWLDSHLHEFQVAARGKKGSLTIGFANVGEPDVIDGRSVRVATHLAKIRKADGMLYWYDFGDSWKHWIVYETDVVSDGGLYPRCLAGRWACPPEDCGGAGGYFEMLEVIADPKHDEYKERREWLRGAVSLRGTWPYKAERFDPLKVKAIRKTVLFCPHSSPASSIRVSVAMSTP